MVKPCLVRKKEETKKENTKEYMEESDKKKWKEMKNKKTFLLRDMSPGHKTLALILKCMSAI
jgi:hypothetical protein